MNAPACPRSLRFGLLALMGWAAFFLSAARVSAQLQWNVFNETAVSAAPASNGANGVTVTVPAGQRVTLFASNFRPIEWTNTTVDEVYVVTTFRVSGGLSGISGGTRAIGYGLYNSRGTPTFADDNGYFTWLNGRQTGSLIELRRRNGDGSSPSLLNPTGSAFNNLGTGTTTQAAGVLTDSGTYSLQLHLMARNPGVSLGNTSSTTSGAGVWLNGEGLSQTAYTNPDNPPATTVFNQVGFMFFNSTAAPVTLEIVSVTGLTPINPPEITSQPAGLILNPGQAGTLTVRATGTAPLAYQWKKDGADLTGATGSTLTLANASSASAGSYTVSITNAYGTVTSNAAVVTFSTSPVPATITEQPVATTVNAGQPASLSVAAFGSAPLTYQWRRNGVDIAGATSSSLSFTQTTSADGGEYTVVVANGAGTVTSAAAVLTINSAPVITTQPVGATVTAGQAVTFTVAASGTPAPTYQWQKDGQRITGATGASYTIPSASLADTGVYTVRIVNSVGAVTSAPAVLAIPSAMAATATFPANGATGINVDTPLSVTFDRAPKVGVTGRIQIVRSSDNVVVDTIDLGAQFQLRTVGTNTTQLNYYPILINGNTASIYPHAGVLAYGQTYHVVVEPGAIRDATNASFTGIAGGTAWRFSTKAAGPAANAAAVTVAADGSGDFSTVQGAIDFVPANNSQRVVITVRKGTYVEQVYVGATRPLVTVRGEDRAQTIITYPNNNNLNGSTRTRGVFTTAANDFTLETLSIVNSTPQGGSQAEAFVCDGLRVTINRVNLRSRQDTLLCNTGTTFITDSYIEGNTDFIWGTAAAYFQRCELKGLDTFGNDGYYTQVRNGQNQIGFVFVDCALTGELTTPRYYLGRIDPTTGNFPYSQCVWINCAMGPHIVPAGWLLNNATTAPNISYWEYQTTDLGGATTDVSRRLPASRQLDAATAAQYRSPAFVLGGWTPQIAPTIEVAPVAQTVTPGSTVRLSVVATGAPQPAYQWFKDGVAVASPSATPAAPRLAWSAFDETASLPVTPTADGKVTVTVPAGQRVTLYTTQFVPIDLTQAPAGTIAEVSLRFAASGGLSSIAAGTRAVGVGLFNHGGTTGGATFADDAGYFTWINGRATGGSTIELRRRNGDGTSPSLLNPTGSAFGSLGTGSAIQTNGSLTDNVPYTFTLRLVRSATGVSFGTNSGNTVAGVWLAGEGFSQSAYTNPDVPPASTVFNQLGFMFLNTAATPVTLTLDEVTGFVPVGPPAFTGATSSTLVLPNVQATETGRYSVRVSNAAGSVTTTPVALTVSSGAFAGTYFGTIAGGGTFALHVRADGTGVFLGSHGGALLSRRVSVDAQGRVRFVANLTGTVDATLSATTGAIAGTFNGAALTGTRSSGPTATLAGYYQAGVAGGSTVQHIIVGAGGQAYVVTQSGTRLEAGSGTVTSAGRVTATVGGQTLTATVADGVLSGAMAGSSFSGASDATAVGLRFRELSARTQVPVGGVSTIGFVLVGGSPVDLLIRGVGPTLATFGVGNALAAPKLDLYSNGTVIASNTRWSTALNPAEIAAGAALGGAFPLAAGAADSALRLKLNPGAYTATLSSATAGAGGVGLVEVYDLTAGESGQRLVNLSALAQAGAGDGTLVAGVIVTGKAPKRMLIRAVGPSLALAGVPGVLARPVLSLFAGSQLIAQNADVGTSPDAAAITAAIADSGAFNLSVGAADSALIVNLAPGLYTAQITSADGGTGTALLEFYELP
ncbi:MAG: immunoglobulin domain-containing protein [Opitutaceae bacterium]|nr:immunoglobulin domain-containing protein [Opitutaceae bacterium]